MVLNRSAVSHTFKDPPRVLHRWRRFDRFAHVRDCRRRPARTAGLGPKRLSCPLSALASPNTSHRTSTWISTVPVSPFRITQRLVTEKPRSPTNSRCPGYPHRGPFTDQDRHPVSLWAIPVGATSSVDRWQKSRDRQTAGMLGAWHSCVRRSTCGVLGWSAPLRAGGNPLRTMPLVVIVSRSG
jgi:hypothetical protein